MKPRYTLALILFITLMLASCTSRGGNGQAAQCAFMGRLGIDVSDGLILGDTLALNDIYCGDDSQSANTLNGAVLTREQYISLIMPAGKQIADEMSEWVLLGVRRFGGNMLAAYYSGNGMGYCVSLITYNSQGQVLDAINAREMHLLWRADLSDPSNEHVFTLDAFFTFDSDSVVTLHRTMGLCKMDFENDLKSDAQWQQQWDQPYVINNNGQFLLQSQEVVAEKGSVDVYATMDYKTWDLLVCSPHDMGVMAVWEKAAERVDNGYDPKYELKPFPLDVTQLYRMNPQRFLRWLASHPDSRILPWFKLDPADRPALLTEIGWLNDANARQRLTDMVNAWDDKPLTKHG